MKVFSKEKFKETQGITEVELRKHEWASRCDGKTVEELKKMPYIISKDWLVEEEDYRKGKDNMEFKVGEKVRIKYNLEDIKDFKGGFAPGMKRLEGEIVTITDIRDGKAYVEENLWTWDLRAFEKLNIVSKDDLKNGDIVTLRNGDRLVFVGGEGFIDLSDDNDNYLSDICDLEDDFTHEHFKDNDIVKIERPVEYTTVFKREEVKEMTVEEISKALGYEVKVVK